MQNGKLPNLTRFDEGTMMIPKNGGSKCSINHIIYLIMANKFTIFPMIFMN